MQTRSQMLKEENDKLKEENKELWLDNESLGLQDKELQEEMKKLKEQVFHNTTKDEIKEIYRVSLNLKEEMKTLKQKYDKSSALLKDAEKFTEKFKNQFIKEREHNEKLLKDYKQLNSDWAKKRDEDGDEYRITINELKEEIKRLTVSRAEQKRISFWRMCESYNGFNKNTNLCDPDWLEEMRVEIEDRKDEIDDEGDLFEGYKEWIGYEEEEEEDSD